MRGTGFAAFRNERPMAKRRLFRHYLFHRIMLSWLWDEL